VKCERSWLCLQCYLSLHTDKAMAVLFEIRTINQSHVEKSRWKLERKIILKIEPETTQHLGVKSYDGVWRRTRDLIDAIPCKVWQIGRKIAWRDWVDDRGTRRAGTWCVRGQTWDSMRYGSRFIVGGEMWGNMKDERCFVVRELR